MNRETALIGLRKFKPYPNDKDSAVEWLREIPAHWDLMPLGRIGGFSASGIDKKTAEGEEIVLMVNYLDVCSEEIEADIKKLEGEIMKMLREVTK